MARSIKNMESTLETVLKSIAAGNTQPLAGMKLADDGTLIPTENGTEGLLGQQGTPNDLQHFPEQQELPAHYYPDHALQLNHSISPVSSVPPNGHSLALQHQHPSSSALYKSQGQAVSSGSSNDNIRILSIKAEEALQSPALRLPSLPEPENTWLPLGLLAE